MAQWEEFRSGRGVIRPAGEIDWICSKVFFPGITLGKKRCWAKICLQFHRVTEMSSDCESELGEKFRLLLFTCQPLVWPLVQAHTHTRVCPGDVAVRTINEENFAAAAFRFIFFPVFLVLCPLAADHQPAVGPLEPRRKSQCSAEHRYSHTLTHSSLVIRDKVRALYFS